MGFITKILDPTGTISSFTGKTGAEAAKEAAQLQAQAGADALAEVQRSKAEGLGFFSGLQDGGQSFFGGLSDVGQTGIDQAGFLTDPNAQFDFLQNNPLFQQSLEQGQQVTSQAQSDLFKSAAARGRLSSGDTLQQVQNLGDISQRNALLAGTNLIQNQKQSIGDLLGIAQGAAANQAGTALNVATNQANTALGVGSQVADINQGIGNALASGQIGAANAEATGAQNLAGVAGLVASFFSDPALKENIKLASKDNGFNIYTWDWNDKAETLGLTGSSSGVMADEVKLVKPDAVTMDRGFMKVDYNAIGVKH